MQAMAELLYKDLGRMDYLAALALQQKNCRAEATEGFSQRHTFRRTSPRLYPRSRRKVSNVLAAREVPVIGSSRGGDVTYHGPGQLVVYPLIDLRSKLRRDVHRYLRNLEMSAIRTLKDFGLEGIRRPPYTGIWVDNRKIAAIGIAVRRVYYFSRPSVECEYGSLLFQSHHSLRTELGRRYIDG